ncbi:MAG: DUF4097 family beta strand repeat-containing protein [Vicinamibacterales bacterium]|jgi:hypothetical protein|nr:DUF4097 family beta strand repeat-containing protein [Vicinamibacterales bacterium]HJN47090.1 DUF4097 family beta strand repeat-containing protein [Vicinamibacterales bacterium]
MSTHTARTALACVATICLAGTAQAQTEEIVRTISMDAGGLFELRNVAGDISVTGNDGIDVTIRATKRVSDRNASGDADAALRRVGVEITQRGNRVEVETEYERSPGNGPSVSVDYEVGVPSGVRVTVEAVASDVTIDGVDGETRVEVVSGAIQLTTLSRLVEAKAVSGHIQLSGVASDDALSVESVAGNLTLDGVRAPRLEASSVSGTISLSGVEARRLEVGTVAGAVTYQGALAADGRYEFESHSGAIRLTVPGSTGFELEAESFSGAFNSDLPITVGGGTRNTTVFDRGLHTLEGTAGDGGARLELATFSGDITIERR